MQIHENYVKTAKVKSTEFRISLLQSYKEQCIRLRIKKEEP